MSETRLSQDELSSVASLHERSQTEKAAMHAFLDSLTDADVEQGVTYKTIQGVNYKSALRRMIVHAGIHGAQFFGEAGALLDQYEHSPSNLDFELYLRTK